MVTVFLSIFDDRSKAKNMTRADVGGTTPNTLETGLSRHHGDVSLLKPIDHIAHHSTIVLVGFEGALIILRNSSLSDSYTSDRRWTPHV